MARPPIPLDARRARLVAADLLSRHAWTRAELTRRLRRRGATEEIATDVVADLAARGYVDDAAFARHWVATRAARLRAELRARGVATPLIDAAVAEVSGGNVLARARAVAEHRRPGLRDVEPARAAARLRDHLIRRGYSAGVAARVVREVLGSPPDPPTLIE